MQFYSHPEVFLINHLNEVYQINANLFEGEEKEVYRTIALCHDFGKYTTYFQRHLFNNESSELSKHGFISAVFGAFVALKNFNNYYPLYVYLSILHHHGNLESPLEHLPANFKKIDDGDIWVRDKIDIFYKQMEDIRKNKDYIIKDYETVGLGDFFNEFLNSKVEDILLSLRKLHFKLERGNNENHYADLMFFYSALISADKLSASKTKVPELGFGDFESLDKARLEKIKGKKDINGIRGEVFNNVINSIKKYKDKSMFTITAPTGTGKTYAGFFAALKLRELSGDKRKIIYSLPFTSIIDQNYDVLEELFLNLEEFKNSKGRFLIKHHSMTDVEYIDENMDYSKSQEELLIENWDSGVVVTTFVQLLETLIGNRNRMLKKFISLRGAVILLDEVQAIDIKFYPLVDFVFNMAVKYLDVKIIMMTATKPALLSDAVELLDDCQKYFEVFNRTFIRPRLQDVTISEFIEDFRERYEEKSYLIVCNTIKQSLDIYNGLKNLKEDIYYLSTNLIPKHRKQRIDLINNRLKNGDKIILVSTQVVEAGVDFDFDVVIRDLAPLDSIIQCAGRCNRNGLKETGEVYIYKMIDDEGNLFSKYVYGLSSVNITKEILEGHEKIHESEYYNLISRYFEKVIANKEKDTSKGFINSIQKLIFTGDKQAISKFSLIQNNPGYIDVFVEVDDEATEKLEKYFKALAIKDFEKRREEYLKIKNDLNKYFISVPDSMFKKFTKTQNDKGIFILPNIAVKDYYDINTGLIRKKEDESFMIF